MRGFEAYRQRQVCDIITTMYAWNVVEVTGKGMFGEAKNELPDVLAELERDGWDIFTITQPNINFFSIICRKLLE